MPLYPNSHWKRDSNEEISLRDSNINTIKVDGEVDALTFDNSGSAIISIDGLNKRVGINTDAPNVDFEVQGQSRLNSYDFDYPAGGYAALRHAPTVSNINESSPNFTGAIFSPNLTYTVAQSAGFGTKSIFSFIPTLKSGGSLGAGSDTVNFTLFNMIPAFNGSVGPRTLNQMFGFFVQPRASGGTVTLQEAFRVQTNANGGGITTGYGFRLLEALTSSGGSIGTYIGLQIRNQTAATDNWSMQIGNAKSYHVGSCMIGQASEPETLFEIQSNSAIGQQMITLDQDDDDQPFVDYQATVGPTATAAITNLTRSGATTHHIQIEINGTKAWIAASTNDPT